MKLRARRIASITASVPEDVKRQAEATAAKYYQLAWSYVQPKQGQLFLMAGLSGSGKSTTAREISRQAGAIQVRSDAVRKHLAGVPLHERGPASLYTPEMSQKTYQRLLDIGLMLAQAGYSGVLDAKYDRQVMRQTALEQAQAHQIPLQMVYCEAPLDVLKARVQARQGDIADATVAVLEHQSMEPFTPEEQRYVTTVDTTGDLSKQVTHLVGNSL